MHWAKCGCLESLCPRNYAVWVVSSLLAECVVSFLKNVKCKSVSVACMFLTSLP
jgi:hypothetical protein